jgi:hypothetical protein
LVELNNQDEALLQEVKGMVRNSVVEKAEQEEVQKNIEDPV